MKLKAAPPPVADINVTPMVDVMLVVLIIFMVITPHLLSNSDTVTLPKAHRPVALAGSQKKTLSRYRSRATVRFFSARDSRESIRKILRPRCAICFRIARAAWFSFAPMAVPSTKKLKM